MQKHKQRGVRFSAAPEVSHAWLPDQGADEGAASQHDDERMSPDRTDVTGDECEESGTGSTRGRHSGGGIRSRSRSRSNSRHRGRSGSDAGSLGAMSGMSDIDGVTASPRSHLSWGTFFTPLLGSETPATPGSVLQGPTAFARVRRRRSLRWSVLPVASAAALPGGAAPRNAHAGGDVTPAARGTTAASNLAVRAPLTGDSAERAPLLTRATTVTVNGAALCFSGVVATPLTPAAAADVASSAADSAAHGGDGSGPNAGGSAGGGDAGGRASGDTGSGSGLDSHAVDTSARTRGAVHAGQRNDGVVAGSSGGSGAACAAGEAGEAGEADALVLSAQSAMERLGRVSTWTAAAVVACVNRYTDQIDLQQWQSLCGEMHNGLLCTNFRLACAHHTPYRVSRRMLEHLAKRLPRIFASALGSTRALDGGSSAGKAAGVPAPAGGCDPTLDLQALFQCRAALAQQREQLANDIQLLKATRESHTGLGTQQQSELTVGTSSTPATPTPPLAPLPVLAEVPWINARRYRKVDRMLPPADVTVAEQTAPALRVYHSVVQRLPEVVATPAEPTLSPVFPMPPSRPPATMVAVTSPLHTVVATTATVAVVAASDATANGIANASGGVGGCTAADNSDDDGHAARFVVRRGSTVAAHHRASLAVGGTTTVVSLPPRPAWARRTHDVPSGDSCATASAASYPYPMIHGDGDGALWRVLPELSPAVSSSLRQPPRLPPLPFLSHAPFRAYVRTVTHSTPPFAGVPNALIARDVGGWGSCALPLHRQLHMRQGPTARSYIDAADLPPCFAAAATSTSRRCDCTARGVRCIHALASASTSDGSSEPWTDSSCDGVAGLVAPLRAAFRGKKRSLAKRRRVSGGDGGAAGDGSAQPGIPPVGAVVRGRVLEPRHLEGTNPTTFNQLWSAEEQAALERLLVKYPAEAVAAKRWAKIARELGTRTPRQVASRMQKLAMRVSVSVAGTAPAPVSRTHHDTGAMVH